jgi:hypothetical protein
MFCQTPKEPTSSVDRSALDFLSKQTMYEANASPPTTSLALEKQTHASDKQVSNRRNISPNAPAFKKQQGSE